MSRGRSTTQREKDRATIRRLGAPCHICGEPIDYSLPHLDPGEFVVDHVVAIVLGGADTLANKRAAHRSCNRAKGTRVHADIVRRSRSLARPGTVAS